MNEMPINVELFEIRNGVPILMMRAIIDYHNVKHRRKFAGLARSALAAGYRVVTEPFIPRPGFVSEYGVVMKRQDCKVYLYDL